MIALMFYYFLFVGSALLFGIAVFKVFNFFLSTFVDFLNEITK